MLYGDVAIVIHADNEMENFHGGHPTARHLTKANWQKSADNWKLLQVHVYVIQKDPPAQTLSSKELDAYAGTYKAGDLTQTLRRDGDHLISTREGRPDITWKAELRDVFFIPGQPRTRKIFHRNANGKVIGIFDHAKTPT